MKNLEVRIKKKQSKAIKRPPLFSILNFQFSILCVSLLLGSNVMADELRLKFKPGDKYSLVLVTEQKVSRVVDSNEKISEQNTRLECDLDVEEVDENGFAWAKYTYKRVTMKLRTEEQKFDFDSDANQMKTPPQAIPLRAVVGESMYLRITPQGRIDKVNGSQALITYAKAKIGNFAGVEIVSQAVESMFTEPVIKRELENQLAVFPEAGQEPITWSRNNVLSSADLGYIKEERIAETNIIFERTFRLNAEKSGQGSIVIADVNLVIKPVSLSPSNTQASESKAIANREISGDGVGQVEIEKATGRIINYRMTQNMIERVKMIAQASMLRPPPDPEPLTTHIVTTFQMAKIEAGKPAPPPDANQKGV